MHPYILRYTYLHREFSALPTELRSNYEFSIVVYLSFYEDPATSELSEPVHCRTDPHQLLLCLCFWVQSRELAHAATGGYREGPPGPKSVIAGPKRIVILPFKAPLTHDNVNGEERRVKNLDLFFDTALCKWPVAGSAHKPCVGLTLTDMCDVTKVQPHSVPSEHGKPVRCASPQL